MLSKLNLKQEISPLAIIIFVIVLLSILLRVVLMHWDNVPFLYSDSGAYIRQAFSLLPAYDRPLGYAVFLRLVFTFSQDLNSVIRVQSILGIMTILGFLYLGRKYVIHSHYGLVLFLFLAAFDLRLILFEHYILSESLSVAMLLPFFYCLFHSFESGRKSFFFYTGLCLGGLILIRTVFSFCIPFTIIVYVIKFGVQKTQRRYQFVNWIHACSLLTLGLLITLGSYSLYNKSRTGNFGVTHFEGYVLWSVAGHPDICSYELQSKAKQIICNNKYANVQSLHKFRNIWLAGSPTSDLQKHLVDKIKVNAVLKKYAIQSILIHPFDYVFTVFRNLYRIFTQRVWFASHMSWVLETNAATQVKRYFGTQHPSLQDIESPIWPKLESLMGISKLYGFLLVLLTCFQFLDSTKNRYNLILIFWVLCYSLWCAALGSGDWSRYYVIMILPLLLLITSFVEKLLPKGLGVRLERNVNSSLDCTS